MNIVYDLRYATDHFPGIGTHAHALLAAFLARPGDDRFTVLWRAADRATRFDIEPLARHERVRWMVVREPSIGPWAPLATGALLRRIGGDVYFSPFYLRPVNPRLPAVLTLPDAVHLTRESRTPWRTRMLFALALRHARGVEATITPSEFSRREIIRLAGYPASRLHFVPQGLPPRSSAPPLRPAAAPERPFALVVGVNRPHKELLMLARVWRGFGGGAPLELVGAGPVDPRFPSLADFAAEAGAPATRALGMVSAAELEWLYEHATLLLFPSRYEGFGFPLLEAAARGVPVIASDIPALRELGDGVARFVAVGDEAAWSAAIRDLAADAGARARMAAEGRSLAARHDYAVVAARTREILGRVACVPGRIAA